MPFPRIRGWWSRMLGHYPLRIGLYYVVLFLSSALVWRALPDAARAQFASILSDFSGTGSELPTSKRSAILGEVGLAHAPAGIEAIVAAAGALLLALPVAWTYMYTRPRKGYRQAMVHTLVLMPVIVAGIVVLVKNSLALAFGLSAIVGAIRFRNTLNDSRDTIFVLVAMGLGLASAVQLEVAVVLSVVFNVIVLVLFYTDFARTPPALEGVRAQRFMEKAFATANRTSQFVAVVDDRILQSLAPAQLDALAERLRKRRDEGGGAARASDAERFPTRLAARGADLHALRDVVDPVLDANAKRWRFAGSQQDADGMFIAEYAIKLSKGLSASSLADLVRTGGGVDVVDVSIE